MQVRQMVVPSRSPQKKKVTMLHFTALMVKMPVIN